MKAKQPIQLFLRRLADYVIAGICPFPALLLMMLLPRASDKTLLVLFFFLLVGLSSRNRNYKTGIVTTVVSALLFTLYPSFSFSLLLQPVIIIQFVLFVAEGILLSFLIDAQKDRERIASYKQKEKELKKKNLSLEEENAIFKKEIHSRDEFLSIASHELKTPLTSMLLQTQTALHNMRNLSLAQFSVESLLKMLESVEHQTKRLSKMINDLLSVSVVTTGNLHIEPEQIDLVEVVEDVLNDFSARIEREKYTVVYTEKESAIGYWDKLRVEQAITNFLSNAIKYGNHNLIEIKVKKHNNWAEFIIKDNGIGISKEKQKRIFELFERGVSAEEYKGLGVGLYITMKFVKAHGGSITVVSKPGKGATFIMRLPITISELMEQIIPAQEDSN